MSRRIFNSLSLMIVIALAVSACSSLPVASGGGNTLKIVSSLPMTGASETQTTALTQAIKLRLEQAKGKACGGKYSVIYQAWDDSSKEVGRWDPAVESKNAKAAAGDSSIILYIGPFNSGAAKLSIPILNQAGPLAMISPSTTYSGLTLASASELTQYYPSGVRNYARLMPPDAAQGSAAAKWAKELGVKTVYVLEDGDLYGRTIADAFKRGADENGLSVVGRETINRIAADYQTLMSKIAKSDQGNPPSMIYVAMVSDVYVYQLIKDKIAVMGDNTKVKVMGSDGLQTRALVDSIGANAAEGIYATTLTLPNDKLPAKGQQFLKDYSGAFSRAPSIYALYGYEAMNVALQAIENVCASGGDATSRRLIRDALFAIKDFDGVLGKWSFDGNGDITLVNITRYVVKRGIFEVAPDK